MKVHLIVNDDYGWPDLCGNINIDPNQIEKVKKTHKLLGGSEGLKQTDIDHLKKELGESNIGEYVTEILLKGHSSTIKVAEDKDYILNLLNN